MATAEPSATVSWLMGEPLTLWDWGMMQLADTVRDALRESDPLWTTSVEYDWDANRIVVQLHFDLMGQYRSIGAGDSQSVCRWGVEVARQTLGVMKIPRKAKEGELYPIGAYPTERTDVYTNQYDSFFSHIGFARSRAPENVSRQLMDLTEIRADMTIDDQSTQGRTRWISCHSPLIGSTTCSDEPQ